MSRTVLAILALTLAIAGVQAQPPAAPPKEMVRFDKILGNWSGSGTTRVTAEGPEVPWTSRSTTRKVMGGHYVRDDGIIEFKGPDPMTLALITHYCWDPIQNRYVVYVIGNTGELHTTEMQWSDENTMIQHSVTNRGGQRMSERWVAHIKKDEMTFEVEAAGASGGLWTMVKGKLSRAKDAQPVTLDKVGGLEMMPQTEQMERLCRLAGNYAIKGTWSMAPNQPGMEFAGWERMRPAFGGVVFESFPGGENYEGYTATVWNAREKRYSRLQLSDWGLHSITHGIWASETELVFTFQGEMMGQRMFSRTVVQVDKNGKVTATRGHVLAGTAEPFKSLDATLTLKQPDKKEGN
jgi:hypothetical protein